MAHDSEDIPDIAGASFQRANKVTTHDVTHVIDPFHSSRGSQLRSLELLTSAAIPHVLADFLPPHITSNLPYALLCLLNGEMAAAAHRPARSDEQKAEPHSNNGQFHASSSAEKIQLR